MGESVQRAFQELVDRLGRARDAEDFREALCRTAENLQLPKFAYLGLAAGEPPLLIATYPTQWTDHYIASRYDRIDPVISAASAKLLPFKWGGPAYSASL